MNSSASSAGLVLSSAAAWASAPRVEIEGLTLAYGRQPVLQDLHWRLGAGQVVGLLGRNGAGKTTLLEALLGLRDISNLTTPHTERQSIRTEVVGYNEELIRRAILRELAP